MLPLDDCRLPIGGRFSGELAYKLSRCRIDRLVIVPPAPRDGDTVSRACELDVAGLRFLFFFSSPNHILKLENSVPFIVALLFVLVVPVATTADARGAETGGLMVEKVPCDTEVDTLPFVGVLDAVDSMTTG